MNSEIFLNIEYRNLYILPLGLTVDVLSWLQKNPEQGGPTGVCDRPQTPECAYSTRITEDVNRPVPGGIKKSPKRKIRFGPLIW